MPPVRCLCADRIGVKPVEDLPDNDALDPTAPVADDDVEGHGIEEDDVSDAAEALTLTGACFE